MFWSTVPLKLLINLTNFILILMICSYLIFSSLYTSIDNNTVIDSFMFLQEHLNIDACIINFMLDLFNYIKHNAFFHIGFKRLFLQKEGLAMGSYDFADIVNLVLFISEISSNVCNRKLYMAKYIDDVH